MAARIVMRFAFALLSISRTFSSLRHLKKVQEQVGLQNEMVDVVSSEIDAAATIVCSAFKAHAVYQHCDNPASVDKLGVVHDRVRCAEYCKLATSKIGQATCCVFTDLGACVAYGGSDRIIDGQSYLGTNPEPAYFGSATVCSHVSNIGGHWNEDPSIWAHEKVVGITSLFSALFAGAMTSGHGEALFRNINPREIKQGAVGDCWLLAVIAAMARFPGAVRKLFLQQFRAADQIYSIQLFNPIESRWIWVTIDDSLPSSLFNSTTYAKLAADQTTWVLLLEKAVAKFVDPQESKDDDENRTIGYSKLIKGYTEFAMSLLTGFQKIDMWRSKDGGKRFIKASQVDFVKGLHRLESKFPDRLLFYRGERQENTTAPDTFYSRMMGPSLKYKEFDLEDVWKGLLQGTAKHRIMTGSVAQKSKDIVREGESIEANGLVGGHAYSILQAKEVSATNQVCHESITVTYTSSSDWLADYSFMKSSWDKGPRFSGASWKKSLAARHGVEEGWQLAEEGALEPPAPTKDRPKKVVYVGVVDDFACDPTERERSGRETKWISMTVRSIDPGTKLRFVQVRNPWGDIDKWTGAWSDGDHRRWTKHMDVAQVLGFAPLPDGMWWMSLEDFAERFDGWSIGGVNMLTFLPNGHAGCSDGYMMGMVRSCIPAHCGLLGTVGDGPNCECLPGFIGKITWSGSSPRGMCGVDARKLFTDGSQKLWTLNSNGKRIKCCTSSIGKPTRLQDMNAELPKVGRFQDFDREGCGCMFGDTYHNGMKMHNPKCIVPIETFMKVSRKSFEETKRLFLS